MKTDNKAIIFGEELEFDAKGHAYKWAGKFVPGVTTILQVINKPALLQWSADMASDYWYDQLALGTKDLMLIRAEAKAAHRIRKETAGGIGNNIHDYAECFFKKKELPPLLTDQAKKGVEAFHKWLDAHKIKILASERMVFSKEHHYAGTCDFVAEIDGVLGVGDIKTSSGIFNEMRFQTAAYQQALEEEKKIKFPVRWIVRFDKKTGKFQAKSFYNFDTDFQGFKAALDLHRAFQLIKNEGETK